MQVSLSVTEGSRLITTVQGTNEVTVGGIGSAGNINYYGKFFFS